MRKLLGPWNDPKAAPVSSFEGRMYLDEAHTPYLPRLQLSLKDFVCSADLRLLACSSVPNGSLFIYI
jgi:hypothetical protein